MIEKSRETGMEIDTVIGDTAYSEIENIKYAKANEFQLVSKLNPMITQGVRKKEDEFELIKMQEYTFVKPDIWRFIRHVREQKM